VKQLAFPFRIDRTGRTALAEPDREVRELLEQILFTAPGERVMRPTLGSGAAQLVFEPSGAQLAASTQHLVQAAIQTALGDRILLEGVEVAAEDSMLSVTIRYREPATGAAATETFDMEV
jgi:phage baseplate assembly protein W